jgi:hypothetical protein
MESQQIMKLLMAMNEKITTREDRKSEEMKVMQEKEEAERKSDREGMKAMQEKAEAERIDREEMIARIDANTKTTLATQLKMKEIKVDMKTMQENIQENLKKTKQMMNMNQAGRLRSLLRHLKKNRWYYKRSELSFDTQARKLQENLEVIKADLITDFTMVGIEI